MKSLFSMPPPSAEAPLEEKPAANNRPRVESAKNEPAWEMMTAVLRASGPKSASNTGKPTSEVLANPAVSTSAPTASLRQPKTRPARLKTA